MLNGPDAKFLRVSEIETNLPDDGRHWFVRPVADSKEQAGNVKAAAGPMSAAFSPIWTPCDSSACRLIAE